MRAVLRDLSYLSGSVCRPMCWGLVLAYTCSALFAAVTNGQRDDPLARDEAEVEEHGTSVVVVLAFLAVPLLFCAFLWRKRRQRFAVGDDVLVRRNDNLINRKHAAVVTAVHVVLRPRTDFVSAADTIWGIVDCCTGDLLKPRAYDVRYSDGGTERAPEAWVSAGRVTERGLVAQLRAQAHDDEEQEATPLLS